MTESDLESIEFHLLRHPRIREVFNAPELNRLLGEGDLDLSMTDQPEALKVRIEAGIAVLERRVLAAISMALRLQAWTCGFIGITLGILTGIAFAASGQSPGLLYARAGGVAVFFALAVFLVVRLLRVRGDLKLLARLRGRYRGLLDNCSDIPALQAAASRIYGEIRAAGGNLEDEPTRPPAS